MKSTGRVYAALRTGYREGMRTFRWKAQGSSRLLLGQEGAQICTDDDREDEAFGEALVRSAPGGRGHQEAGRFR